MKKLFLLTLALCAILTLCGCEAYATEETLRPVRHSVSIPDTTASDVTQPTASTRLSPEQAQEIALKHAGLTADQVRFLRTEFEIDRGIPKYEIEFTQGSWEYEYDIQAKTGEILSFEKDR